MRRRLAAPSPVPGLLAVFLLLAATGARAAGGPENVLVVVNEDSWASLTLANEYVHLRQIPPGNVLYLKDLGSFEHIGVDDFRTRILHQVLQAIENRGLTEQIDCVAYSSDLPWAVDVNSDVGKHELPNFITRTASINGLTYLHTLVTAKDIEYLKLDSNYYVRRTQQVTATRPWSDEQQAALRSAYDLLQSKQWPEALLALCGLAKVHPEATEVHYNIACCLARMDRPDDAVAALGKAVAAGWANAPHTLADEDLEPLRPRDDFKRLLETMKQPLFDIQPTVAFKSTDAWSRTGMLAEPFLGRRYLLSTVLGVTSGRGNSVREALESLRRSAAADGTAPKGTVYFMRNGDIRSKTREWAFASAAARLNELGIAAEVIDGVLPQGKADVAGAVIGIAGFDWMASGSTILPGAICEHLTSTGGVMSQNAGQTPLTEFIRYGAAGASGTVTEPMAIQAKFPMPFMHVHYARGCSLAEAFYQSVAGPYQLLIVGDPLCRPWAKIPEVTVEGVAPGATVKGVLKLQPAAKPRDGLDIARYELLLAGSRHGHCKPGGTLTLDTTTLADGYHDLRVVAVTADVIQTQGHLVLPIIVNNRGQAVEVTGPAARQVVWAEPLKLRARLAGARQLRFLHHGRVLATIEGEEGDAEIDTRRLGLGPVRIDVTGHLPAGAKTAPADDRTHPGHIVAARPVEIEVVMPPALPAIEAPPGDTTTAGLKLTPEGREPVTIESTHPGDWLAKAGVKKGQSFVLEGYFDVPADDIYQFQIHSSAEPTIEVDSRVIGTAPRLGWRFLPVHLAAGTHHLRVAGTFTLAPRMDLRFGGPGARSVAADRFRHVRPPAPPKPAEPPPEPAKPPEKP